MPCLMAQTVIPGHELPALRDELATVISGWMAATDGFEEWLSRAQAEERARGAEFQLHRLKTLDASSPNRPGPFEVIADGAVHVMEPGKGLNAFSHALEIPEGVEEVDGIRVRILPEPNTGQLTPHPDNAPKITTVLVSAGTQPAKQVEFYNQLLLSSATSSSSEETHIATNVLDERNLQWWQPASGDAAPHLTVTFDEPVRTAATPYLTVMVFYGRPQSLPYQWRIDAFSGKDTDSRFSEELSEVLRKDSAAWSEKERSLALAAFREDSPTLERMRVRIANLQERINVLTEQHSTLVMDTAPKL